MNNIINFTKKIIKKIIKKTIKYSSINDPLLYATLLVKNEEDIIEENILFHKKMGVDYFIVTDNNSTDNTYNILKKYLDKGWIKEIILEKSNDYSQCDWVDRMIKLAKNKYEADWIMNIDADEFWYSKRGDLKFEISQSEANILKCNIYNILPENEANFFKNNKMIVKYPNTNKYELSKFNIYGEQIPKVIHRSQNYRKIQMGNHSVKMFLPHEKESKDIEIFHYAIKGQNHFKNKMINGGKNVEKNIKLGKEVARHWRYFYEGYKSGRINLDEEYKKVIGKNYIEEFSKCGIFEERNEIKKIIEKIKEDNLC